MRIRVLLTLRFRHLSLQSTLSRSPLPLLEVRKILSPKRLLKVCLPLYFHFLGIFITFEIIGKINADEFLIVPSDKDISSNNEEIEHEQANDERGEQAQFDTFITSLMKSQKDVHKSPVHKKEEKDELSK